MRLAHTRRQFLLAAQLFRRGHVVRSALRLLLAGAFLGTAGCALWPPDYGYKRPFPFGPDQRTLVTYQNGTYRNHYNDLVMAGQLEPARLERNRILQELLYAIDSSHGQFTRDSIANKGWLDVGSDFAILGLSGAGAVAGGAGTKAILAAIVGGVQGAQLTVNKRVFREQAIEALQAQMGAAMLKRKAQILERMKTGVDEYSLDLGLSDIVNYYYDGTFTRAFQNLVAQAKNEQEAAATNVAAALRPAAAPEQIDDMAFLTDQLKALRTAPEPSAALERARKLIGALGGNPAEVASLDQALEKLRSLVDDLVKPENRGRLPQTRKVFEAIR